MSAEPRDLAPDLVKVRREFEELKRRVRESGDLDSIDWLNEFERNAQDLEFWKRPPTAIEQLHDHLKRLGVRN
jgi:hypothetical protein